MKKKWDKEGLTYYCGTVVGPHRGDDTTYNMYPDWRHVKFDDNAHADVLMTCQESIVIIPVNATTIKPVIAESVGEYVSSALGKTNRKRKQGLTTDEALQDFIETADLTEIKIQWEPTVSQYPAMMTKRLGWPHAGPTKYLPVFNLLNSMTVPGAPLPSTGPDFGRPCPDTHCRALGLAVTRYQTIEGPAANRRPKWRCDAGGPCADCPKCRTWLSDKLRELYGVGISAHKCKQWLAEHAGLLTCECVACGCGCTRQTFIADPTSEQRAARSADRKAKAVDDAVLGAASFPAASKTMQKALGGIPATCLMKLPEGTLTGALAPSADMVAAMSRADGKAAKRVGPLLASNIEPVRTQNGIARERKEDDTNKLAAANEATAAAAAPSINPAVPVTPQQQTAAALKLFDQVLRVFPAAGCEHDQATAAAVRRLKMAALGGDQRPVSAITTLFEIGSPPRTIGEELRAFAEYMA